MAAQSRNRPRSRLAWLIVLALILLVLVATRAAAAPNLGTTYANALVGCAACDRGDAADMDDDEDSEDGADADADADADEGDDRDDGHSGLRDGADAARAPRETGMPLPGDVHEGHDGDRDDELPAGSEADGDRLGGIEPEDVDRLADAESGDALVVDAEGLLHGDMLDDEMLALEAIDPGVTLASGALGDVAELRDVLSRHQRPSRFGRIDLSIAWRRAWTVSTQVRSDALWIVATWRR